MLRFRPEDYMANFNPFKKIGRTLEDAIKRGDENKKKRDKGLVIDKIFDKKTGKPKKVR
jgi:hypothetical protein